MTIQRELHVGGREVPAQSGRTTDDVNPFTGEVHATVAAGGPEDITRAVEAADEAFPAWAALPPSRRRQVLARAADVLEARADEAATTMTAETGAVLGWGHFNAGLAARVFREAAAAATLPVGDVLTTDVAGQLSLAVREPVGVVAAFAPWNAPLILGARAIATPLVVGNTAVLKPSEEAPIAGGLFLSDVLREAGLPDGVLNVVTNDRADAPQVAEALVCDPRVRVVNFTGSTGVGRIIGGLAARELKPAVLELGGKNAVLVLSDADLDHAVDAVAFGSFANAGQICMSTDRVLVHRSIAEEFTERLAKKVAALPHGDPADPGTVIGPLVDARAARRVADLVAEAVAGGARVRAGGGEPEGAHHPATVLDRVTPDMRIHHEEVFGPVVAVIEVADDDEAVAIANDTPYGLTAGVLTEDTRRGLAVARRLRTGIVHVGNQTVDDEPQAPFGGVGASGYGRFGGRWGVEAFTTTRWVTVAGERGAFPF
ncbi:aldehyde dehydrogenase family protein [Saccharothrix syringae]|uniref:Aldehyde dehydrogenase family protein n=1 Tax=Saccharothrix syringae TaxID=103733 RepID=A0A5Q0H7B4_SACSY|nr:aldehyde dehydrogenase family protein [Saccharothrix syringae]QFZ21730.1 aldehyde dehydrogenase family protein [Saccharothrix syringae]